MDEPVYVVFNPHSGKGRGAQFVAPVLQALAPAKRLEQWRRILRRWAAAAALLAAGAALSFVPRKQKLWTESRLPMRSPLS